MMWRAKVIPAALALGSLMWADAPSRDGAPGAPRAARPSWARRRTPPNWPPGPTSNRWRRQFSDGRHVDYPTSYSQTFPFARRRGEPHYHHRHAHAVRSTLGGLNGPF